MLGFSLILLHFISNIYANDSNNAKSKAGKGDLQTDTQTIVSCIRFDLYDTMGDGWDSARLKIVDKIGHDSVHFPTSRINPMTDIEYCFDSSLVTSGHTVTSGVYGMNPRYESEIYWTATLEDGTQYLGTYKTFMTFVFDTSKKNKSPISLSSSHNLLKARKSCLSCIAIDYESNEISSSSSINTHQSGLSVSISKSGKQKNSKHRLLTENMNIPITSALAYEVFGSGQSWYSLNGYGTSYEITSSDGLVRYFSGSYCEVEEGDINKSNGKDNNKNEKKNNYNNKEKGDKNSNKDKRRLKNNNKNTKDDGESSSGAGAECDITTLSSGIYVWRVTGAFDENKNAINWEFCGVKGSATTEVIFEIDDLGQCIPLKTQIYSTPTSSTTSTTSSQSLLSTSSYSAELSNPVIFTSNMNSHTPNGTIISSTYWTLKGHINIYGLRDTEQAKEQAYLLPSVIADSLNSIILSGATIGVHPQKTVEITAWSSPGSIFEISTHITFAFEAGLIPESYGYDSMNSDEYTMNELADNIQSYIQTSIDSGIFFQELAARETLLRLGRIGSASTTTSSGTHESWSADTNKFSISSGMTMNANQRTMYMFSSLGIGLMLTVFLVAIIARTRGYFTDAVTNEHLKSCYLLQDTTSHSTSRLTEDNNILEDKNATGAQSSYFVNDVDSTHHTTHDVYTTTTTTTMPPSQATGLEKKFTKPNSWYRIPSESKRVNYMSTNKNPMMSTSMSMSSYNSSSTSTGSSSVSIEDPPLKSSIATQLPHPNSNITQSSTNTRADSNQLPSSKFFTNDLLSKYAKLGINPSNYVRKVISRMTEGSGSSSDVTIEGRPSVPVTIRMEM